MQRAAHRDHHGPRHGEPTERHRPCSSHLGHRHGHRLPAHVLRPGGLHLTEGGLDFQPGDTEGILLFTDLPHDSRSWRYAALAPTAARLTELEVRLTAAL